MDPSTPDTDPRHRILDVGYAGTELAVKLTTLASENSRTSGRATVIAKDVSLIANVLYELDEVMRRRIRGSSGNIKVLNDKGISTVLTYSETCKGAFEKINLEVDSQLDMFSYPGDPKLDEAAEDILTGQSMDRLRLELKEAKEALMLVLQVAVLARPRILSKAGTSSLEALEKSDLSVGEQSLLIRAIKAKVSIRKPPVDEANRQAERPDADSGNDADRSQDIRLDTVNSQSSGSALESALDTSTTLAPSETDLEQTRGGRGLELPDENEDVTGKGGEPTFQSTQSGTRAGGHDFGRFGGKSTPRPEEIAAEVNETSSSTQPSKARIPYLMREGDPPSTRPAARDTAKDREVDEWSLKSGTGPVGTPSYHSTGVISRYEHVSCLTMLRSLLSRRNDGRQRAEGTWQNEVIDNLQRRRVLHLVIMRPYIKFVGQGYFVGWSNLAPKTEQHEIAKQLVSERRKDSHPVTEQIAKLSITESEVIGGTLKARPDAVLLFVSSTPVDLEQDGMKLHGIPETRYIFRMADERRRDPSPRHDLTGNGGYGERRHRSVSPKRDDSFPRPTYMKVSLQYLDPRTLNAFALPWEFDPETQYTVIVKKYLNVDDQDVLFDHTKKIRRHDLSLSVPSKPLREDKGEDRDNHKKTPQKPTESEIDSLFLRLDSRKELEEENKRFRTSSSMENDSSTSVDDASREADGLRVVDLLLAKYTTVFDEAGAGKVEPIYMSL